MQNQSRNNTLIRTENLPAARARPGVSALVSRAAGPEEG